MLERPIAESRDPREFMPDDALWTAEEARDFDLHLQQELGLPAALLMENAAAALARLIAQISTEQGLTRILLLAGRGHNGADALVAARHLAGGPWSLRCALPLGPPRPGSLGESALAPLSRLGLAPAPEASLPELLADRDLVVDGLYGIGLDRPLEGAARACVEALNASGLPVLAVDLPSGLDASTGEARGAAVRARWTLSFVGRKAGLARGAGPAHAGAVSVAGIGVHADYASAWLARRRAALRR